MPVPGPDTRVVELRVHGDAGDRGPAAAERLLDAVATVDVAGGGVAGGGAAGRFVRPADRLRRPAPGPVLATGSRSTPRIVEGYLREPPRWRLLAVLYPFWMVGAAFSMLPRIADRPAGRTCGVLLRGSLRLAWVLLGVLLLAQLAVLAVPGLGPVPLTLVGALLVVWLAFTVVLLMAAVLARREAVGVPSELRPWAGGLFAAPVLLLAVLLGAGFGAVLSHLRSWVFGGGLPAGYPGIALLWALAAAVTAVSALSVLLGSAGGRPVPVAGLLQTGDTARLAASAVRRAGRQRATAYRLVLVPAGTLALGGVLLVAAELAGAWPWPWSGPSAVAGVVVLALLGAGLQYAAVLPERRLGAPGFLARLACPAADPRAGAVLPDLVGRAKEHLREPNTRLVLTGEGHGGLRAALAAQRLLAVLPEGDRCRLGLVVAGSGMQWVYPRAFPAVLGYAELMELSRGLGTRWRSLCRGTDPLGGAVTTWRLQVDDGELTGSGLLDPDGSGALPAAATVPTGALVLGGDHWLPDPASGPVTGRRWVPGVRGHAEYVAEEEWDRAVSVAAGLEPARGAAEQAALFRLPSRWAAAGRRSEADSG